MLVVEGATMRPRFLLFGDSITQLSFVPGGWGAALASHYARKADVVLRGYSGYNTRWALFLLHKIFPSGQSDSPLLVTVFFGANDAALSDRIGKKVQHVPLPEYRENLRKIISHIKGIRTAHVVLITPPPVDEETWSKTEMEEHGAKPEELPSRSNVQTGAYAEACVEVAKEEGVAVIDLWSTMQEKPGWQKIYLSDGLHLTPDGNAIVFEGLTKVLKDKGLAFEHMKWDFPEWSEVDSDEPGKSFC